MNPPGTTKQHPGKSASTPSAAAGSTAQLPRVEELKHPTMQAAKPQSPKWPEK